MEWTEADPLPQQCQNCQEEDCWECDDAGRRWYLPAMEDLKIRRKGLLKAIERYQRQIAAIEKELKEKYHITEF